jgi:hypothetical protein
MYVQNVTLIAFVLARWCHGVISRILRNCHLPLTRLLLQNKQEILVSCQLYCYANELKPLEVELCDKSFSVRYVLAYLHIKDCENEVISEIR